MLPKENDKRLSIVVIVVFYRTVASCIVNIYRFLFNIMLNKFDILELTHKFDCVYFMFKTKCC